MEQTKDYSKFKSITSNREVDQRHVNRLVDSIYKKNMLSINPIIVTSNFEVIDGQHRLAAAEALGIPVYYIIDDGVSKNDIAILNSNSKNWTATDYVNFYTIEKKPGFDKLSFFLSKYPSIPVGTAMSLMSLDGKKDMTGLREGKINTANYDHAVKVAETLVWYRNIIDWAFERNFLLAVSICLENPNYDHEVMKRKLEFQSRSLVKCINKKQYLELLEEIYNYKSSTNRIRLS